MNRPRLSDEEAEEVYREYCLWLSLAPKKLAHKHGISKDSVHRYGRREHKRKRAA